MIINYYADILTNESRRVLSLTSTEQSKVRQEEHSGYDCINKGNWKNCYHLRCCLFWLRGVWKCFYNPHNLNRVSYKNVIINWNLLQFLFCCASFTMHPAILFNILVRF